MAGGILTGIMLGTAATAFAWFIARRLGRPDPYADSFGDWPNMDLPHHGEGNNR